MEALMILIYALVCSVFSQAAIPPLKTTKPKAFVGGVAASGEGFSLKDVALTKNGLSERVIIDLADLSGAPVKGNPTYYHAELKKAGRQLVIDLTQTGTTFIDEKKIKQKFKNSKFVSAATLLLDPTDQTMSLIFDLNATASAKFYQVPGQKGTSRIVVDLK
jgi:hypothetical protein